MFTPLNINKSVDVTVSAEVETKRELNLAKMIESMATETNAEIASCYYGNGTLNEDRADRVLQSIRGRMTAMKLLTQSMQ